MDWLLCSVSPYFGEGLVDFHDLNLISQAGPAAQHVGIILPGAARLFRLPVTEQLIVRFAVAVEEVASVILGDEDRAEFAKSGQRRGVHVSHWLPDGHREYPLRHKGGL